MNEVLKAIHERRSVRAYADKPIADADLKQILEAGVYAPSARNSQAWHVTAIHNPDTIARLNSAVKLASQKPGFNALVDFVGQESYSINYKNAPVFIIVSVDPQSSFFPDADGALVLGNIFLAAHALGIGSCWINQLRPLSDEPGFRQILTELGVPEGYKIIGCSTLGYPAGSHPQAPARKPATINIVR